MTQESYQLSLDVIIEVMKGLHKQVTLRAHVPAGSGRRKSATVAHIVIDENGLQTCVIAEQDTGDTCMEGREAVHFLQRCGTLNWTLQPSQAAYLLTRRSPEHMGSERGGADQIPARQVELTPIQMQALPPPQKKVFALVNGKNTIEQIAHLLTKTPQEIYHVLLELKRQQLIII